MIQLKHYPHSIAISNIGINALVWQAVRTKYHGYWNCHIVESVSYVACMRYCAVKMQACASKAVFAVAPSAPQRSTRSRAALSSVRLNSVRASVRTSRAAFSRSALMVQGVTVTTVPTKPIEGQKTGTSGLRKKTQVFMGENYLANWVQCLFNALPEEERVGSTMVRSLRVDSACASVQSLSAPGPWG